MGLFKTKQSYADNSRRLVVIHFPDADEYMYS